MIHAQDDILIVRRVVGELVGGALALLGAAPRHLRLLLMLLLDCGLRITEATSLSVGDVRDGFVRVSHAKGGRDRLVPYGREVDVALRRFVTRDRPRPVRTPDEPLFLNRRGGPLRPAVVRKLMRSLGTSLGIEGVRVSPHTLRHTFARQYLVNGGGELALQQVLGHRDLAMVRRYVLLGEADLTTIHRAASPLDGWWSPPTRTAR